MQLLAVPVQQGDANVDFCRKEESLVQRKILMTMYDTKSKLYDDYTE